MGLFIVLVFVHIFDLNIVLIIILFIGFVQWGPSALGVQGARSSRHPEAGTPAFTAALRGAPPGAAARGRRLTASEQERSMSTGGLARAFCCGRSRLRPREPNSTQPRLVASVARRLLSRHVQTAWTAGCQYPQLLRIQALAP